MPQFAAPPESRQPSTTTTDARCAHCGDPCRQETIRTTAGVFCCAGCQAVYTLLHDQGLGQFYRIEERAGRRSGQSNDYAWLDDADTAAQLLDYADDDRAVVTLELPAIHCTACIYLLEHLYRLHAGVMQVRVYFAERRASIHYAPTEISLRELAALLDRIGYPPQFNLRNLDEKTTAPRINRTLGLRLGLAGFVFGNVMLLSFPEYLGLEGGEDGLAHALGYLNLLLVLPVAFYSAADYWRAAWYSLRQRRLSVDLPIVVGIIVLLGRSAFDILTHTGAGYCDSLAGLVFFLLVGKWFQQLTYRRLSFENDYRNYFPLSARIVTASGEQSTPLNKISTGDTVRIRQGELLPADGRLRSEQAEIDYSFVTGEAEAVLRQRGDQLYAGGRLVRGSIELTVDKPPQAARFVQLWQENAFQRADSKGNINWTNQAARVFTPIILLVAVATLGYWLPRDPTLAWRAVTAVLIIACPCALALAAPFALGTLLRRLARSGYFLKDTATLERLAGIDTVVFDKTGTLTNPSCAQVTWLGTPLTQQEQRILYSMVRQSNHPLSRSLAPYFADDTVLPLTVTEVVGAGLSTSYAGHQYRLGAASWITAASSLVADPGASVVLQIDADVRGGFRVRHALRPQAPAMLVHLQQQQLQLALLSGDGDQERDRFSALLGPAAQLNFRREPLAKLHYVEQLQRAGQRVLMLGDGLNDAGALRQSQVGLILSDDTNNFNPACDGIVLSDALAALPDLLVAARRVRRWLVAAYGLAFVYNVVGLGFAVQGLLEPVVAAILMPLSSITVAALASLGGWHSWRGGLHPNHLSR